MVKKGIDFSGQQPYCELPFTMDTINDVKLYRSIFVVFEGFEKKYKAIKIVDTALYKESLDIYKYWRSPDLILKRLLYILYLHTWRSMEKQLEYTKELLKDKKLDKIHYEYHIKDAKKMNIENYNELKIVFGKLIEERVKRVYIVNIDNDVLEDALQENLIKDTMKRKGFSEWVWNSKKDVALNILAGQYFSLKNIKNMRDEGVMYIKQLEAKYNKQMKEDAK
jgi:hypothetical protein